MKKEIFEIRKALLRHINLIDKNTSLLVSMNKRIDKIEEQMQERLAGVEDLTNKIKHLLISINKRVEKLEK